MSIKNKEHIHEVAYNRGFSDFLRGKYYDTPYRKNSLFQKEYIRGLDSAYFFLQFRRIEREKRFQRN